ncbi:MAG: CCA tRNA nucleotidyltransferase, partial [Terriglobales bacterium]
DYDVATDAPPEQVMRLFRRHSAVGAKFGVVLVHGEDGETSIEVATFRTDKSYRDGRHPEAVEYTRTPEEDVARRDFTVNGLLERPETGEVLDFVGGRADLKARLMRAIGDPERRFREDHLRMLRGVRLAARLGFALEPATLAAMQRLAQEIAGISQERVRDELLKMLTEGRARAAFELLETTGLLREVLPEVAAMRGVEQPREFHPEGDVWTHTLLMLERFDATPAPRPPDLALALLLHDVGKPKTFRRAPDRIRFDSHAAVGAKMAEAVCNRLRVSGSQTARVVELVSQHMKFKDLPQMRESTRKRFLRQPGFEQDLELHRIDCLSSHGDLSLYELARKELERTPAERLRPPRLLSGADLIAMGYAPGPQFREMLEAAEDA